MKKAGIVSGVLAFIGVMMISIALMIDGETTLTNKNKIKNVDLQSVAASANMVIKEDDTKQVDVELPLQEVAMEIIPASIIIPPRVEVYDSMTMEELAAKFNRILDGSYLAGKGELIASYSLQSSVDPYIAMAIILHETGCSANCSRLVVACNNVGGQKGSPGCGGGAYKAFPTLDEGIVGFINNLNRNYFAMGLNTVEKIGPKYAEGNTWVGKINWWVEKVRNS